MELDRYRALVCAIETGSLPARRRSCNTRPPVSAE